ncbi:MAG: hypothetical protein ABIG91_00510 [Patescibacteria group bacterium]
MNKLCVFCGRELNKKNKTRDHIPSRNLFPEGTHSNKPIIIKACFDCNNRFSLDEEWFRLFLVNITQDKSFTANQMFHTKIKRSIQEKPAIGKNILSKMEEVILKTDSGIILGPKTEIKIDKEDWLRFFNILDKYVKGIYYHYMKKRIEDCGYEIGHHFVKKDIFSPMLWQALKWNKDNETVFIYGFASIHTTQEAIISLIFYENVGFISFVSSKDKIQKIPKPYI